MASKQRDLSLQKRLRQEVPGQEEAKEHCCHCNLTILGTARRAALAMHLVTTCTRAQGRIEKLLHRCLACTETFKTKADLANHAESAHGSVARPLAHTRFCQATFTHSQMISHFQGGGCPSRLDLDSAHRMAGRKNTPTDVEDWVLSLSPRRWRASADEAKLAAALDSLENLGIDNRQHDADKKKSEDDGNAAGPVCGVGGGSSGVKIGLMRLLMVPVSSRYCIAEEAGGNNDGEDSTGVVDKDINMNDISDEVDREEGIM